MKPQTILLAVLTMFLTNSKDIEIKKMNFACSFKTQTETYKQIKKMINTDNIYLNTINTIVSEKLSNKTIKNIQDLFNINYELEYYLITFEEDGYLIFDTKTQNYEEYSESSNSPYLNLDSFTKIYVGPKNYYYIDNNDTLKNALTDETVNESTRTLLQNLHAQIEANKIADEEEISTYASVPSNYDIPHPYYFKNLHENIPINFEGSCSYIALEMALGYFENFGGQAGLIPEEYIVKEQVYSENMSEWEESSGTNYAFHYDMLQIGKEMNIPATINFNELKKVHEAYSKQIASSYNYSSAVGGLKSAGTGTATLSTLINYLINKYVLVLGIIGSDPDIVSGDYIQHAVVAYGYVDNGQGMRVHFGEKTEPSLSDVIIRKYTIANYYAIKYTSPHKHSKNYYYVEPDVITYMCPCGEYFYHEHDWKWEILSDQKHRMTCKECGETREEDHKITGGIAIKICKCGYMIRLLSEEE